MPTCILCGKIDASLRDGVCGDCLGAEAAPIGSVATGSNHEADADRSLRCVRPATFIRYGLALSLLGALLTGGLLDRIASVRDFRFLALSGIPLAIAGGILLSVGIIRWAIWPLIERRDG
jgi:hypothetical protein